jgi:hypothetical protein
MVIWAMGEARVNARFGDVWLIDWKRSWACLKMMPDITLFSDKPMLMPAPAW